MRVIAKGRQDISRILGKQKVRTTTYRLMRYVLRVESEDEVLLYNVLTGQLVLLDFQELQYLDSATSKCAERLLELIEGYYLVPLDFDEKELVVNLRKVLRSLFDTKGINSFTILTTTNCNARCFYCYQDGYQHMNMSPEIASQLVQYIADHKSKDVVRLHWFGGEPLLGASRIDDICKSLQAANISFSSSMISNGYLFTEDLVKRAMEQWHLTKVQITLDGTEQIYNTTKCYINATGNPYVRVVNNIKTLIDHHIHVSIRMNLDKHNMDNLKQLADDLRESIGVNNYLSAYVKVLFENEGSSPIKRDRSSAKLLYAKQVELSRYLDAIGLSKESLRLPSLETHHCMADGHDSVVVFPDGKLYKCEHTKMGDDFGSITTDNVNEANLHKFQETVSVSSCDACPLFPKCILLKVCNGKRVIDQQEVCQYEIASAKLSVLRYWTTVLDKSSFLRDPSM